LGGLGFWVDVGWELDGVGNRLYVSYEMSLYYNGECEIVVDSYAFVRV
jgi:hypothetical protein